MTLKELLPVIVGSKYRLLDMKDNEFLIENLDLEKVQVIRIVPVIETENVEEGYCVTSNFTAMFNIFIDNF